MEVSMKEEVKRDVGEVTEREGTRMRWGARMS